MDFVLYRSHQQKPIIEILTILIVFFNQENKYSKNFQFNLTVTQEVNFKEHKIINKQIRNLLQKKSIFHNLIFKIFCFKMENYFFKKASTNLSLNIYMKFKDIYT